MLQIRLKSPAAADARGENQLICRQYCSVTINIQDSKFAPKKRGRLAAIDLAAFRRHFSAIRLITVAPP
jgi:hypothetical protein